MLYLTFVDQIFRITNASSEHFRSHSRTGRQVEAWQNENMKNRSRQGEDEGEAEDLMKKVEDGEVDAHTGMTGDPPFLCEEEQMG